MEQRENIEGDVGVVQMGGPEGVRATEQYTLVVGLTKGMLMHAIPRDSPTIRNGRSVLRHEE